MKKVVNGVLSQACCNGLIELSEEIFNSSSIRGNGNDYKQATDDLEVTEYPKLRQYILPLLPSIIKHAESEVQSFDDVFIVRYDMKNQRKLVRHVDGGDRTIQIALSSRENFVGGGTLFDDGLIQCNQGSALVFDSSLYHAGVEIKSGQRYLLVLFCHLTNQHLREKGTVTLHLENTRGVLSRFDLFDVHSPSSSQLSLMARKEMRDNTTYFHPFHLFSKHDNHILRFVEDVFNFHVSRLNLKVDAKVAGCEFWFHKTSSERESMDFHFDKDEQRLKILDEMVHPTLATITYLSDSIQLPTLIFGEEESILCFPHKGRHISFGGNLLHGCPHNLMIRKRKKGADCSFRLTLMVNLWCTHQPMLDEMGEFRYYQGDMTATTKIEPLSVSFAPWTEVEIHTNPTVYGEKGVKGGVVADPEVVTENIRQHVRCDWKSRAAYVIGSGSFK